MRTTERTHGRQFAALLASTLSLALAMGSAALAQGYPAKPILLVSTTPQGNIADVVLRTMSVKITEGLGQQLIIENRTAATGTVGAAFVARSAPDGYTLLHGSLSTVTAPLVLKSATYDVLKDFAPIGMVLKLPSFILVHPSVPSRSLTEFVDYIRRNPGKVSYGSTGIGSVFHFAAESLKLATGAQMTHVPYNANGFALAVNDILSGTIQVYFPSLNTIRPHVASGKLRVVAVVDESRHQGMPDLPTVNESYASHFNVIPWFGLLGPAGLPRPIADRISGEVKKALFEPGLVAKVDAAGGIPIGDTPDAFGARLRSEVGYYRKLADMLDIKPE